MGLEEQQRRIDAMGREIDSINDQLIGLCSESEKMSIRYRLNTLEAWRVDIERDRGEMMKRRQDDELYYAKLKKHLITALVGLVLTGAALVSDGLRRIINGPDAPAVKTNQTSE